MLPTPQKATHDYVRNGTLDLFAALEVATGKVITDLRKRHTTPRPCASGYCAAPGSTSTSPPPRGHG
jgi:hypothetical protein